MSPQSIPAKRPTFEEVEGQFDHCTKRGNDRSGKSCFLYLSWPIEMINTFKSGLKATGISDTKIR